MAALSLSFAIMPFVAQTLLATIGWRRTYALVGLAVPTVGFLPYAAAFLIGVGEGAQLDVIPYMVSRYFALTAFAEIYGYLFAVFTQGGGVGPMLMGKAFDALSSYGLILAAFAVATLAASALMTKLGPYHVVQTALQLA